MHCHLSMSGHFARMQIIVMLIVLVKSAPFTLENEQLSSMLNEKVLPSEAIQQRLLYHQDDRLKVSNSLLDILDWLKQDRLQKRHLFLSDGWGAGGRPMAIKPKSNRNKLQTLKEVKIKPNKNDLKKQQRYYTLKWSIPGLFGEF